jgi:hypothetical protein
VPVGLGRRPLDAKAFYAPIGLCTLMGISPNIIDMHPMRACSGEPFSTVLSRCY